MLPARARIGHPFGDTATITALALPPSAASVKLSRAWAKVFSWAQLLQDTRIPLAALGYHSVSHPVNVHIVPFKSEEDDGGRDRYGGGEGSGQHEVVLGPECQIPVLAPNPG